MDVIGTNPLDADSDGDGLLDVVIIEQLGLADLLQLAPASVARA